MSLESTSFQIMYNLQNLLSLFDKMTSIFQFQRQPTLSISFTLGNVFGSGLILTAMSLIKIIINILESEFLNTF